MRRSIEALLVERHETGYGLAVVSHGHIVAVPHDAEIATEVVSEFSHAGFHPRDYGAFQRGNLATCGEGPRAAVPSCRACPAAAGKAIAAASVVRSTTLCAAQRASGKPCWRTPPPPGSAEQGCLQPSEPCHRCGRPSVTGGAKVLGERPRRTRSAHPVGRWPPNGRPPGSWPPLANLGRSYRRSPGLNHVVTAEAQLGGPATAAV